MSFYVVDNKRAKEHIFKRTIYSISVYYKIYFCNGHELREIVTLLGVMLDSQKLNLIYNTQ